MSICQCKIQASRVKTYVIYGGDFDYQIAYNSESPSPYKDLQFDVDAPLYWTSAQNVQSINGILQPMAGNAPMLSTPISGGILGMFQYEVDNALYLMFNGGDGNFYQFVGTGNSPLVCNSGLSKTAKCNYTQFLQKMCVCNDVDDAFMYDLTGVYSYKVTVYNNLGESGQSDSVLLGISIPQAPSNLQVQFLTNKFTNASTVNTLNLTWIGYDTHTQGYNIYRSTDNVSFTKIDTTTNTNYQDILTSNGTYYYKVTAYNNIGESTASNTVSEAITVSGSRPSAPSASISLITNSVTLTITADTSTMDGINIFRSTDGITWSAPQTIQVTADSMTYTDTIPANTTFYYMLNAFNSYGESGYSSQVACTTSVLPIPTALSLVSTGTSIALLWTNTAGSPTGYNIYRSTDGETYTKIATSATNSYTDTVPSVIGTIQDTGLYKIRGNVGNVCCSYASRLWIAQGANLYYSDLGDPTQWVDDPANNLFGGYIDNFMGNTDNITGLYDFGVYMAIFTSNHIYLLSGNDPSTFSIEGFEEVGCSSPNGAIHFNGTHYFFNNINMNISPISSYNWGAGQSGSDTGQINLGSSLTERIHILLASMMDLSALNELVFVRYPNKNQLWMYFKQNNVSGLSAAWVFDFQYLTKNIIPIYLRTMTSVNCACEYQKNVYTGDSNGQIYLEDTGNTISDVNKTGAGSWYQGYVNFPKFELGQASLWKRLQKIKLLCNSTRDNSFNVNLIYQGITQQTVQVPVNIPNKIFTLGTNTLDDGSILGQDVDLPAIIPSRAKWQSLQLGINYTSGQNDFGLRQFSLYNIQMLNAG